MQSDLEIAQSAPIRPIEEIARKYGLTGDDLIPYGRDKAKIRLSRLSNPEPKRARYVDVTAVTPTPLGEGKTTTAIGLTQGLGYNGHKALCSVRQPSMGPTFGIKGGAAGGGYSQIIPMEDFNLHLTGDVHAVGAAHNLAAAGVDARIYHEARWSDSFLNKQGLERLNIDPYNLLWHRVVDMNDRALRSIVTGLGGASDGPIRESAFDITAASEIMAVLALAKSPEDLRTRLGRIILARDKKGRALTAEDFGLAGAMAVLLKDALLPNLMQTLEGQAALVHTGPFGNIAHGNSSVIADLIGSSMGEYLVTESGFGADMGMEKFFHIKCRASGLIPDVIVLVVTVRALKMHGGGPPVKPGRPLDPIYREKNTGLVREGCANLTAHIETAGLFGIPLVVAINAFPEDTREEWKIIKEAAHNAGATDAVVTYHWAQGGEGSSELARAVEKAADQQAGNRDSPPSLYNLDDPLKEKIKIIANKIYRAGEVEFSPEAKKKAELYDREGFGGLPLCMAKTQYSLSHNPAWKNIPPPGYIFPIRDIRLSAGAGFVYPLAGEISTMPGLGSRPAFMGVDLDSKTGKITGLF